MNSNNVTSDEIKLDVDLILWSTKLSGLYRFTHQRFWEKETFEHEYAMRIDGVDKSGNKVPRAESVAEHSWHIADIILILAPKFKGLNIEKCLLHAILHDKLEIITGDKNPLGKNGKGTKSHAFNEIKKQKKDYLESQALNIYLKKLNSSALSIQKEILEDTIELATIESKFVKAIDKIHPLTYIIRKKQGDMLDEHISFTLKYSRTYYKFFPGLEPYYSELIHRLFVLIGQKRNVSIELLQKQFSSEQLDLFKL